MNVGCQHEEVGSVVAINSAPTICDATRPRNFLLLAAANDGLIPLQNCFSAIARATAPIAPEAGVRYGDQQLGTARQLVDE